MSTLADSFAQLLAVLDRMEIPYEVGGPVVTSIAIAVDLKAEQIGPFADELRYEFYADAGQIREAFAKGRAANVIHLGSVWKFDLFPLRSDEYSRMEFSRRAYREIRPDGGVAVDCAVASVEDTICASWSGIAPGVRVRSGNGTTCAGCAGQRVSGWISITCAAGRNI